MKGKELLNLISLLLGVLALVIQTYVSIEIILKLTEINTNGDVSPRVIAGGIKTLILLIFPVSLALIFGVLGISKTEKYRRLSIVGTVASLIAIIMVFVPFIYIAF